MTWDTVIQGSSGSITLFADRVIVDGDETECPPDDAFVAQLNEFADCVRERRAPGPSGKKVLATMAVLDGVLESMRDGCPVELPELGVQW